MQADEEKVSDRQDREDLPDEVRRSKLKMIFPVSKVLKRMKAEHSDVRVSKQAAVPMASALEYLLEQVLQKSGDICSEEDSKITPLHLSKVFKEDKEFSKALGSGIIIPFVASECSTKKSSELIIID